MLQHRHRGRCQAPRCLLRMFGPEGPQISQDPGSYHSTPGGSPGYLNISVLKREKCLTIPACRMTDAVAMRR